MAFHSSTINVIPILKEKSTEEVKRIRGKAKYAAKHEVRPKHIQRLSCAHSKEHLRLAAAVRHKQPLALLSFFPSTIHPLSLSHTHAHTHTHTHTPAVGGCHLRLLHLPEVGIQGHHAEGVQAQAQAIALHGHVVLGHSLQGRGGAHTLSHGNLRASLICRVTTRGWPGRGRCKHPMSWTSERHAL
eukprot:1148543-Pelagomonas_calceolata.AAC.9